MGRASVREKIIQAGVTALHQQGYAGSGVRDITRAAGVPLGSFSNHFRSKEAFALIVLERYFVELARIMQATLLDEARPPLDRLRAHFDTLEGVLEQADWRYGCMIANMSAELPGPSELVRCRMVETLSAVTEPFAAVLRAAQLEGALGSQTTAEELAEFIVSAWHGALLRMKVQQSREPLTRFKRVLFALIGGSPDLAA